jgi:hypothetical protein
MRFLFVSRIKWSTTIFDQTKELAIGKNIPRRNMARMGGPVKFKIAIQDWTTFVTNCDVSAAIYSVEIPNNIALFRYWMS